MYYYNITLVSYTSYGIYRHNGRQHKKYRHSIKRLRPSSILRYKGAQQYSIILYDIGTPTNRIGLERERERDNTAVVQKQMPRATSV